jgi:hypothetical protein
MRKKKLFAALSAAVILGGVSLQAQSSDPQITMPGPRLSGDHLTPEQEQQLRDQTRKTISNINAQGGTAAGQSATGPAQAQMPPPPPPPSPATGSMTPDQEAKVREALHQAEMSGKAATAPAQPAMAPATPTMPAQPAMAVPPPPMMQKPAVTGALSADEEARVRETLHQAEMDMEAKKKAAAEEAARTAKDKQAAAMAAQEKMFAEQAAAQKAAADKAAAAKAQAEATAKEAAAKQKADAAMAARQKQAAEMPAKPQPTTTTSMASSPIPMAAPALGISGSKEKRLADLLDLYKADKITPTEYHQQRAKILAEP